MLVIVVEDAPPRLRGRLAVWMLEVRAGVYVGDLGRATREEVWKHVVAGLQDQGNAVAAWTDRNEQGYSVATFGANRRVPVDCDGMMLVAFNPLVAAPGSHTQAGAATPEGVGGKNDAL